MGTFHGGIGFACETGEQFFDQQGPAAGGQPKGIRYDLIHGGSHDFKLAPNPSEIKASVACLAPPRGFSGHGLALGRGAAFNLMIHSATR
jgi:hypothetical protein